MGGCGVHDQRPAGRDGAAYGSQGGQGIHGHLARDQIVDVETVMGMFKR